jgi:hypothetical protein
VHDDVAELTRSLAVLLTEDAAWVAQSHAQRDFAQNRFSFASMQKSVLDALEAAEAEVYGIETEADGVRSQDCAAAKVPVS